MAKSEIRATLTLDCSQFSSQLQKAMKDIEGLNKSASNMSKGMSGSFDNSTKSVENTTDGVGNLASEVNSSGKGIMNTLSNLSTKLSGAGSGIQQMGGQITDVGKKVTQWGKDVVAGFAPIAGVLGTGVKSFVDYDAAMNQLQRTSGMSDKQMEQMKKSVSKLSDELRLSETDVTNIASGIAAYGVTGVKDLSSVTDTAVKMQNTFEGVSADDAARSIAQFGNVSGMTMDKASNLGSAIAWLADNSTALAGDILETNNRIGAMGKIIGMTADQTSAWSTALLASGLTSEVAGTSWNNFQSGLSTACARGGEDIEGFAQIAGMSAEEFVQMYQNDASGATMAFVEGLYRISESGGSVTKVLDELGITGANEQRMLLGLVNQCKDTGDGYSLLEKYLQGSNEEFEKGAYLNEQYEESSKSLKSILQGVKAELQDTSKAIGEALRPALEKVLPKVLELITRFKEFVQEHPKVVQAIAGITAAGMAIGGIAIVIGGAISAVGQIISSIGMLVSALGFLMSPVGLVIAGIAAFAAGLVYCWNNVDGFKEKVMDAFNRIKEVV